MNHTCQKYCVSCRGDVALIIGNRVGIMLESPVGELTALEALRESDSTTVNTSVILNHASTIVISSQ